jgi:hypothetical protein
MLSNSLPTSLISPQPFGAKLPEPFHPDVPQLWEKRCCLGNGRRHHALALALAALALMICLPAHTHEIETGAVLICDTEKQVERYAQLFDGNQQVAIRAVNTEENTPNACALVDVAYVQGPHLSMARSSSYAFRIAPLVVVGVNTSHAYESVAPALFFTPVEINELAV